MTRRISRGSLLRRAAAGGAALSMPAWLASRVENADAAGGPYVGEIRMFAGNFAPSGWAFCNGQMLPISENETLFFLIGTTYGGDGEETFALPDLRGRLPIHKGTGPDGTTYILAEAAGVETVTLTMQQLPTHNHPFVVSQNPGGTTNPPTNVVGEVPGGSVYIQDQASVALNSQSLAPVGGSQPHQNMQPYLSISFILSLFGVYPQQN